MQSFYLMHQRHGRKIAMHDKERESDVKSGWKEVTKEEFYKPKEVKVEAKVSPEVSDVSPELSTQYEKKFGKPPHHRMKAESIKSAVEAE